MVILNTAIFDDRPSQCSWISTYLLYSHRQAAHHSFVAPYIPKQDMKHHNRL